MSKFSCVNKNSISLSGIANNVDAPIGTESPSNVEDAVTNSVSPFEPVKVLGRSNRRDLILGAELMQKRRAARATYFPKEMFGEVAWDIMMTLYVEEKSRSLSLTAISMLIQVPMSTLLRWITYLEIRMLVTTVPIVTDARVRLLKMTDTGRNAMDECMTDLLQA